MNHSPENNHYQQHPEKQERQDNAQGIVNLTPWHLFRGYINLGEIRMTTQEKLNEIFCKVFDDEDIEIHPTMTANDVDGWDSLSHVNLIVAVEGKFGLRFTQKEILTFKNVGDLLSCIDRKLSEKQ